MSLRRTTLHTILFACLAAQFIGISDLRAQFPSHLCLKAKTFDPEGVEQLDLRATRSAAVYRLPVPAPGVAAFDAVMPITSPGQMRIGLLDVDCPDAVRQMDVIRETPGGLLVRAREPGAVYVKVKPVHRRTPTSPVMLHAVFAAEPAIPDTVMMLDTNPPSSCATDGIPSIGPSSMQFAEVTRNGVFTKDVEPEDCDVLEGGFAAPGVVIVEAKGSPLDAALFAGRGCTKPLVEGVLGDSGNSLVAPVFAGGHRFALGPRDEKAFTYTLAVKHLPLCPAGSMHTGLLRCAAVLDAGTPVDGVLAPGHERAFTFLLEEQRTVALTVEGRLFNGALYHNDGVRLDSSITCGEDGCGLVATLPEGRYGLRLTSAEGKPAPYAVALTWAGLP